MPARRATCVVISPDETFHGKQDLDYFAGVSAESAGSTGLCMHIVTFPPQARAKPHLHENHETAIYVLSGEAGMWYGDGLRQHLTVKAGQLLYIPANMPHLPYNPSETAACTGVLARTDPKEQESVAFYPASDPLPRHAARSGRTRIASARRAARGPRRRPERRGRSETQAGDRSSRSSRSP